VVRGEHSWHLTVRVTNELAPPSSGGSRALESAQSGAENSRSSLAVASAILVAVTFSPLVTLEFPFALPRLISSALTSFLGGF